MNVVKVELGGARGPTDGSRRYTPNAITFDTRPNLLATEIQDDWEPAIADQWRSNKASIREGLMYEFGVQDYETKIQDFTDLGVAPWSVVALHNTYLAQVRSTFIAGAYYPALLGACGLGERILNQLVLTLRDDFQGHSATRHVEKRQSVDDWRKCIKTLQAWTVFDDTVAKAYLDLMEIRHGAVHYRTALDDGDARATSLQALRLLGQVVEQVFSPHPTDDRYFHGPIGRTYVRLEAETDPFIKHFMLPACVLVSPVYAFAPNRTGERGFDVYDDSDYGVGQPPLSDTEFADPAKATPQVVAPT